MDTRTHAPTAGRSLFSCFAAASLLVSAALAQPTSTSPLAAPANGPRRADPTWTALSNCTLHVNPDTTLEHATVVFRDGIITAVLPGSRDEASGKDGAKPAKLPIGPRVYDCSGLHVYAAFIEPYADIEVPAPAPGTPGLHWSPRVTPQRSAIDGISNVKALADSLRPFGFGAACISPRGGVFRGSSAVVSLAKGSDDASADRPPVYLDRVFQAVGFESGGGYPSSEMGAISLIRQTLLDAEWMYGGGTRAGDAEGDVSCLKHLAGQGMAGMKWLFDSGDELQAMRWGAMLDSKEFGGHAGTVLLGSGQEYQRLAPLAEVCKKHSMQLIVPLVFPRAPDVAGVGKSEDVDLRDLMAWEQAPTNPRRIAKAGIPFALTTAKLRDRSEFRANLKSAIKHGLTEQQALAALTTTPARMLGVQNQLGTIEVGKRANLLVADGPVFGWPKPGKDADAKTKARAKKEVKFRDLWIDGQRHELNAPPGLNLEGTWTLEIAGAQPAERSLIIEPENAITIKRNDKTVKAQKVSLVGDQLSFVFDHEPLDGQKGVYAASALVEVGEDGKAARLVGSGLRASGERFQWTATLRPRSLEGAWPAFFDTPRPGMAAGPLLVFDRENSISFPGMKDKDGNPMTVDGFSYDGTTLRYSFDQGRMGVPGLEGVVNVRATIDWDASPPLMRGQIETARGKIEWRAARRDANPFIGTWRATKTDDAIKDPAAAEGLTFTVTKDSLTLTFTRKPKDPAGGGRAPDAKQSERRADQEGSKESDLVIHAADVKFEDGTLTFNHDLAKLGMEGKSFDTVTFAPSPEGPEKDEVVGESTLPDGSKHTYRAIRWKKDAEEDEDDDASIKDIPEQLGLPFGPYARLAPPEQRNLLILNATVWTSGKRGIIKRGVVRVSKGKIVEVAPMSAMEDELLANMKDLMQGAGDEDPTGADQPDVERTEEVEITRWRMVDATGKHITPGIIDCHSHTGISGGVNEGAQAVTSEVRVQDVTNPDSISWYRQLAGGVTTVNNLHGSANSIGGQSQTNKIRWGCAYPSDMHFAGAKAGIKFALGENPTSANSGGRADPSVATVYPQTRMGVEMQIRDRFTAAKEYLAGGLIFRAGRTAEHAERQDEAVHDVPGGGRLTASEGRAAGTKRRDLELEALAEILTGDRIIHCHSYRQDEIVMLTQVARDFGFKIGTFQHILEGYKVADYVRDYSGGGSAFSDWWAYKVEVQDAIPQGPPLMHEVGVVVSYNSDSDEMARRMNLEAAKAVKYGNLSEAEALAFVTINPAKQLKIDQRVGSLGAGMDADFVIWSGNPLSTLSRCEATYIDGRCYFSIEQDARHREQIRAERQRLIQKLLSDAKKKSRADASGGDRAARSGGAPGAAPAADPGQGRRRRPPNSDMGGSDTDLTAEELLIEQWYLEKLRRGGNPDWHEAGICGCGLMHEMK